MAGSAGVRRRWWVYLGVVAALATASALDPDGLRRHRVLAREVEEIRADNARLAAENARLAHEVRALRNDPAALERAAREELRWIRPGERVFLLGAEPEPQARPGGAR